MSVHINRLGARTARAEAVISLDDVSAPFPVAMVAVAVGKGDALPGLGLVLMIQM